MAAPTCSECGGRRWVRYFSETTDGDFEEAFRLCPCNHEAEARGERASGGEQNRTMRIVCSFDLKFDRKVLNGWLPGETVVHLRSFRLRGDRSCGSTLC
jgi:hypothetical protein